MIIYFAGVNSDHFANVCYGGNILTTYWETRKWEDGELGSFKRRHAFERLFLDCGAYTAWTKGETIDIDKYCHYLKANADGVTEYPQLDVKGDIKATVDNLAYMEKQGLTPMPVFHMTTMDVAYFKELIDRGYKRIAIGAVAGEKGERATINDLKFRSMFNEIVDKKTGVVKCKLHAFGVTGITTLLSFPFWSADSTSWLGGAKFGHVPYFDKRTGKLTDLRDEAAYKKYFLRIPPEHRVASQTLHRGGRKYLHRLAMGRLAYLDAQDYITRVWEKRGISFID